MVNALVATAVLDDTFVDVPTLFTIERVAEPALANKEPGNVTVAAVLEVAVAAIVVAAPPPAGVHTRLVTPVEKLVPDIITVVLPAPATIAFGLTDVKVGVATVIVSVFEEDKLE